MARLPSYTLPADWSADALEGAIRAAERDLREGRAQRVVDSLQRIASQPQVDSRVSLLYGRALFQLGNASLAIWPLARAAGEAPATSDAAFMHARALLAGGDSIAAVRVLSRLLEAAPRDARLLRLRSRAHQRSLDYESALEDLQALIELEPDELSAIEARISLLVELDRTDEARAGVKHLGERAGGLELPDAERARYCSAEALFEFQAEEPERAEALFMDCLDRFPAEPNVILPWSHFLDNTGRSQRAIEFLEQQVEGDVQGRPVVRATLARFYVNAGRREEAEQVLIDAARAFSDAAPLFQLADQRVAWGDLDGAREAVHQAIEARYGSSPSAPEFEWSRVPAEGRFAFGDLLIRAGQDREVEALIESFEKARAEQGADQEEVYPILLRARLALEHGRPESALELFEESFRYWPSNAGARFLAGRAAMELGFFDRAISFYRDAFRADPTQSGAVLVLGRLHLAEGYPLSAAEIVSTSLGQNTDQPEVLLLFAQVMAAIEAFEASDATRQDLLRFHEWVGEAHKEAALEIAERDGIPAALAHLETVADFGDPAQFEALSQWLNFRNAQGHLASALERIETLRAQSPEAAEFALVWARAKRLAGDDEQALAGYQEALAMDRSLVSAWVESGALRLERAEFESAQAAFEAAASIAPTDPRVSIGLADVALASGRIEQAKAAYRRSLVDHPWQTRAAIELARIDFGAGETGEQTLVWARWAARFAGDLRSEAAELLGEIRMARGEARDAATAFRVAAQHATAPARPLYRLAAALVATGETDQARAPLEKALELGGFVDPDVEKAARRLMASLLEEGRS